jgi:preprotein translocase subunit SecG
MEPMLAFTSWHYLYSIPLSIVSVFLILVILVQRGRGGGLTGALGGMGGQSAFGTKAGDLFTKITIVVAAVWILLSMLAIQRLGRPSAAARRQPPAATKLEKVTKRQTWKPKMPLPRMARRQAARAPALAKLA